MDLLERLERSIEQAFEGLFSRGFRGRVQPAEIARRIIRSMEDEKFVSVSQTFVPNQFTVHLHPDDYSAMAPFISAVIPELERHVMNIASASHYDLSCRPIITLVQDEVVDRGAIVVVSGFVAQQDQAVQTIDPVVANSGPARSSTPRFSQIAILTVVRGPESGLEFSLAPGITTIGRGATNEVVLTDANVSRSHAEIHRRPDGYHVKDLGSKNGTFLNGYPVAENILEDGDNIIVGETHLEFRSARTV